MISWSEGLLIGITVSRSDQFDRGDGKYFIFREIKDSSYLRPTCTRNSFPNSSHKLSNSTLESAPHRRRYYPENYRNGPSDPIYRMAAETHETCDGNRNLHGALEETRVSVEKQEPIARLWG